MRWNKKNSTKKDKGIKSTSRRKKVTSRKENLDVKMDKNVKSVKNEKTTSHSTSRKENLDV